MEKKHNPLIKNDEVYDALKYINQNVFPTIITVIGVILVLTDIAPNVSLLILVILAGINAILGSVLGVAQNKYDKSMLEDIQNAKNEAEEKYFNIVAGTSDVEKLLNNIKNE